MARAQGARAQMALTFETNYGTPPVGGFTKIPFASTSLGAEQPLLNSELLGYRIKHRDLVKTMRLNTDEFIRRFLIHVLPSGFHRIRHTGFLANGIRRDRIADIRSLLDAMPEPDQTPVEGECDDSVDLNVHQPCPKCGGAMIVIETFARSETPKSRAPPWEAAA